MAHPDTHHLVEILFHEHGSRGIRFIMAVSQLFLGFYWVVFGVFSDVFLHMFPLMEGIPAHVTLVI